ncbi:MAG: ABC transporter substrate-binding protein [Clostridium sp.]|uniref:ABC transporter substrate-binding protein n=1 Tax=Clostridium sp. TaxID=1506 RepID=UPI002FC8B3E1
MKWNFKAIIIFVVVVFLSILAINHFGQDRNKVVSGNITIWGDEYTYSYIKEAAEKFEESNKKVNIEVVNVSSKDYFDKLINTNKKDLPNIVQLNSNDLTKVIDKHTIQVANEGSLVNTYKMNFPESRIKEVTIDDQIVAIPATSNPLVLYLREDVLKEYGYTNSDINTWDDLIKVSKDIYKKSKGKYKGLSAVGKDLNDLESLLIMQNMEYGTSKDKTEDAVKDNIKKLRDENVLTKTSNDGYFGAISSINGMKQFMSLDVKCAWTANNAPASKIGGNRFYVSEGENFAVLNSDGSNIKLINTFLESVTNNTDLALKYAKEGEFFPSYLYTYKSTEIEKEVKNFEGKSPLVVMSNIYKKAPEIEQYDDYIKIKEDLLKSGI